VTAARHRVEAGELPPLAWLAFQRGDLLARLGRADEAEQAFEAEIRAFPSNARAYASLAVLHASEGRSGAVDPLLRAMVEASPLASTIELAAETAERLGSREEAAAWRRRAAARFGS